MISISRLLQVTLAFAPTRAFALAGAVALLAACAAVKPPAPLHERAGDGVRWKNMDPTEREASPATKALIRELNMATTAMEGEIAFLTAKGATKGQLRVASDPIQRFQDLRQQISAILIDSSKTAPYHRRFNEVLYSRHADDPRLDIEQFDESLTFLQTVLPVYGVRESLDPDSQISIYPYNMGRVYVGVAGTAPNAVRDAYSPPRSALFDDASVPRVYRFSARQQYSKDFSDFLSAIRANHWRVRIPSIDGGLVPMKEGDETFIVRAIRLGIFTASRADSPDLAACTDAVVFYWAILDDDPDVVGPDEQRYLSIFLGADYIITPADKGPAARAYEKRRMANWIVRSNTPVWRVAVCAPFEAIAKLFIGAKQTAFEAAKAPVAVIAATPQYGPVYALESAGQSFSHINATLETLTKTWPMRWPHQNLADMAGETPIIGKIIPPIPRDVQPSSAPRRHIYLTRGTGGGGDDAQFTQAWQQAMSTAYARLNALCALPADVAAVPYRYGTACDTVWSILNLSDGPGYQMARDVLFPDPDEGIPEAHPGEAIYLAGHGAGVQRCTDAARVLLRSGSSVGKIMGYDGAAAGPISLGASPLGGSQDGRFVVMQPGVGIGAAAGGPRSGERAAERGAGLLPRLVAGIVSAPVAMTCGVDLLAPTSAQAFPWTVSPREAGLTPGAFDPSSGLINWRPLGEDSQRFFLP